MMDLKRKLQRLLPQPSDAPTIQTHRVPSLDHILHGQEVSTPFGACYMMEKSLPLTALHGHWPLREVLDADYGSLRAFRCGLEPRLDLKEAMFLDTETTGLAGGTGTYAFLVGLGCFTATHFVVKQLLMRDYNEELALLYLLDQELQQKNLIISFNGKTFDLPLLQTRFTISRAGFLGAHEKQHLDLLHLARRLWRHKLSSCSLGSLEENILGVRRVDDIPGYEIPQRYFEFLQTGNGGLLQNIVEHNVIDIVSMSTLLYRLLTTVELKPEECDCSYEAVALANLSLMAEDHPLALRYLEIAATLTDDDQQYVKVMRQAASILKRMAEHEKAALLWQRILSITADDLATSEELAKYYEHRARDLLSAEYVTRRALAMAWHSRSPKAPALEHRLKRIERKVHKGAL